MKKVIIAIIVIAVIGVGIYFFMGEAPNPDVTTPGDEVATTTPSNVATTTMENKAEVVIGKSVEGRDIKAYNFGTGEKNLLFVGGIHGGYEWNTVLVAYELVDYLKANPTSVPEGVKVTVIPVLNPDGLAKVVSTDTGRFTKADVSTSQDVVISGRFNANVVDLNRNFDCDWQANGTWQSKTVSGGTEAFSEPESEAIKGYIETNTPDAVVVWYSAANGVFASSCHNGVLPETNTLTNTFAKASGYKAYEDFNFYEITGDMVNWLAKSKIPAISVLLATHDDTEWTKNLAGIKAVLEYYAE